MTCRVLIILALIVTANAKAPADVCFWKSEKCCYKWQGCGVVARRTEHKHDCPYKKCKSFCFEHCFDVGENKKKCKKFCKPHCHLVYATCITYKHYEYAKFCPKLGCATPSIAEGNDVKPKIIVSTVGKFVGKQK